jgi:hypothetical protein
MSLRLPDEDKVEKWLQDRGIHSGVRELHYNPALYPDCASELIELFKRSFSFYVRAHIAGALFARRLSPSQKQEAVGILLTFIKDNPERSSTIEPLVNNELPRNVDASRVHDIGAMMFDTRYGPVRPCFADVLRKIGNQEAISYLKRAAQDRVTAHSALVALARLQVSEALALCEAALKIPNVLYRDVIQETTTKLKRRLTKEQGARSHVTTQSIPDDLKEWSSNLDGCDLPKVLRTIQRCVKGGFAKGETTEVRLAADDLSVDQTVRFKFDVKLRGTNTTLWLEIFCDDEDAYDLYIFGISELVDKIEECERNVV